jgi:RNA polymerase sigma-70 factor (ECF subfamily)
MGADKRALVEQLFVEHDGALRAFLFRRIRRKPEAAELAQEVYARMLKVPDVDAIENPQAYLFRVAANLARERELKIRAEVAVDVDDPAIQPQIAQRSTFDADIDTARFKKRLHEVLLELSPKCRAAVALQFWHGLSYQEIAQRLGVSTHQVKKYLSKGLGHCRRRMGRSG